MSWHDFFYFAKGERRALILLLCLIVLTVIVIILTNPAKEEQVVAVETTSADTTTAVPPPTSGVQPPSPTTRTNPARRESVPERISRLTNNNNSSFTQTEKFTAGTVVELNAADSLTLQKIPGIGPAFARRIVRYRDLLGGFYTVGQLGEVYGIDEDKYYELAPWFRVDTSLIRRLAVNELSQDSLRKHPYINYAQARAIDRLRRQKKQLTGWENLQLLNEFTEQDRARIEPYLSF